MHIEYTELLKLLHNLILTSETPRRCLPTLQYSGQMTTTTLAPPPHHYSNVILDVFDLPIYMRALRIQYVLNLRI